MSTKSFAIGLLVGILIVAALLGAYGLGNSRGYNSGNKDGRDQSYTQGYTEGFAQGYTQGSTATVPYQHDCNGLTLDEMVTIGLTPVEAALELVNTCGYTHDQAATELATYYKRTGTTGPLLPAVVP